MEGMTYLAIGYLGMLGGITLWTYTLLKRFHALQLRLTALETATSTSHQSTEN